MCCNTSARLTRATPCITANLLQTNKVDAQCDELATTLRVESRQFAATAPVLSVGYLVAFVCVILHLAVSIE